MEDLTIGQRLAVKRKELGLSQIELGERMGVSRQAVSKWEADAAIPEIDKLIALSKLFRVSVGWLLGVEPEDTPDQEPEQAFTDREWEIIDRLTQQKPPVPRWLVPLAAAAAAVSVLAAAFSGLALSAAHSHGAELASLRQSVASLAYSLSAGLQEVKVLESYEFVAQPSSDLDQCTFRFAGIPAWHESDSAAELVITLGNEVVVRQECAWDGSSYTASFTLPACDGYSACFCVTGADGIVRTSQVYDHLLSNLMDSRSFGTVSVDLISWGYDGTRLDIDEMRVILEAPYILRDIPGLWSRCDLVVLGDGQELGRTDLLNRSPYSKEGNFSGIYVDFLTKGQDVVIGDISGIQKLELLLSCELSTGLEMHKSIDTFHCAGWR